MKLVTLHLESVPVGRPLPFSIRDERGILLANKGFLVKSLEELVLMLGHREQLFIDVVESEAQRRAYPGARRRAPGTNRRQPICDV